MIRRLIRRFRKFALPTTLNQAISEDRLTYLSEAKLQRLSQCLTDIDKYNVPGELIEFGVALGGSGVLIAQHAIKDRNFHGFDVFGMIPPPDSLKDDMKSKERYRIIASGQSPGIAGDEYYGYRPELYSEVCETFARYGRPVDGESVILYKGLFEDTWPCYPKNTIAFSHIDCDWYEPVSFCLKAITPHLGPGSVIIIDDYNDYGGCRVATDEFLLEHPDKFTVCHGSNLILRHL